MMLDQQQDEIARRIENKILTQMKETQALMKSQNESLFQAVLQFHKDNQEQWKQMSERLSLIEAQVVGVDRQGVTMRTMMETVHQHVEELWEGAQDPGADDEMSPIPWKPGQSLQPAYWRGDDVASSEGEVDAIITTPSPFPAAHPSATSSHTLYQECAEHLDKADSEEPPDVPPGMDGDSNENSYFPNFDFPPPTPRELCEAFTPAATTTVRDDTGLFSGSDCSSPLSSAPSSDDDDESLPDAPTSLALSQKALAPSRRASMVTFSDIKPTRRRSEWRRASTSTGGPSTRKRARPSMFGPKSRKRLKIEHPIPIIRLEEPSIGNVIACDRCDTWFHYACVNITANHPAVTDPDAQYVCRHCKKGQRLPKSPSEDFICTPLLCKFDNRRFSGPDDADNLSAEYTIDCFVGRHRRPSLDPEPQEYYLVKWDNYGIEFCQWKSAWSFPYSIVNLMKTFERAVEKEGLELRLDYLLLPEAAEYGGPWTDEVLIPTSGT